MAYTEDTNGFILIKDNPISKSGVFPYLGKSISPSLEPDQVYQVWRPEEELNNPKTIESFKLAPWIKDHTMLGEGYTNAEDVGVQGVTGEEVYFRDGTLYANLKLFGEKLKQAIRNGLKELSCGFGCTWEIKSGITPDGTPYDVIQRGIHGNHLASVPEGRMGKEVSVAMDRAVFALDYLDIKSITEGENMELEKLVKAVEDMQKTMDGMQKGYDGLAKDMEMMKSKAEDMEAEAEKKAEDMEEEEKKKAEDEEKKSEAMDSLSKQISDLHKKVEGMAIDGAEIVRQAMKAQSEKAEIVRGAVQIIGAFDHSEMDANAVAKHVLEKKGIACDSGQELSMFKGILLAQSKPAKTFTVDYSAAFDGAEKSTAHIEALKDIVS